MFWIARIPDDSVDVDDDDAKARMRLRNFEVEDYGDLCNALADGPSLEAQVSFDVRWKHRIAKRNIRNPAPDQRFSGVFTQTDATVEWSATENGFAFDSDPASTSTTVYAEVGNERNGVFFSQHEEDEHHGSQHEEGDDHEEDDDHEDHDS